MKITTFLSLFIVLVISITTAMANPLPRQSMHDPVTAESIGLAALAKNQVSEHGLMKADMRTVPTATGNKVALSLTNDGLIGFAVGEMSSGNNQDYRDHSVGHKMVIMAKSVSLVLDRMINMKGLVEAHTVEMQNGEIVLLSIAGR